MASSWATSCGAAAAQFGVARLGCRVVFFLFRSGGWERVLDGCGGDLVGAVVVGGVALSWLSADSGKIDPMRPGCKVQPVRLLSIGALV